MAPGFTDPLTARIAEFLIGIGIPVATGPVPDDSFLPGITLVRGGLVVDEASLKHPGDLLHEAGHIAVAPASARPSMTGGADIPGLNMQELEFAAIPWSYAAALAIGIDPAEVFHGEGYHGLSAALLRNFAGGVPPGVNHLQDAGMTVSSLRAAELGVAPYPHMLRWLRQ